MRAIGIDPGTGSFDFFGMEEDKVIIDASVSVPDVALNPLILIDTIKSVLPLDMISGPSSYGMPVTPIRDMTDKDMNMMVPDDKSIPLYDGIRMVLKLMQKEELPVWFTPGVIHLSTVPSFRKANKIDMGTADKVCIAALAIRDQSERLGINYKEASFILAEIGYAFTAVIGVENGWIVDGIGGTSGGPGFITLGSMDAELAVRLGSFPGALLFTGGAKDISGKADLTPEKMAKNQRKYSDSWNMLMESVLKSVAAMTVAVGKPREIVFSGRLSRIPEIESALRQELARFGSVRRLERRAKHAKEAAEGAYILGEGLMGGKYQGIVESLQLRKATGTMYDYVIAKGAEVKRP
ncbi:DUF1464 family protein [Chloroflexota bacterium]